MLYNVSTFEANPACVFVEGWKDNNFHGQNLNLNYRILPPPPTHTPIGDKTSTKIARGGGGLRQGFSLTWETRRQLQRCTSGGSQRDDHAVEFGDPRYLFTLFFN